MSVRQHRFAPVAALIFLWAPASVGQEALRNPPAQASQGENPLTTDQHRRLAFLAGQWEEEITYAGEKEGSNQGRGRWMARLAYGLYLQIQYEGTSPAGPYRAFGVLTWDRDTQGYRLWWFDNTGGIGEYRGSFTDDNNLVLEYSGRVEGKPFRERIRYTRVSPDEVRTTIDQAWESGEYKPYLVGIAHRAAPGPGRGPGARPPDKRPPESGKDGYGN